MLSEDLDGALSTAFKRAREKRHEYITVEHLLLALLDNSMAIEVLSSCGANIERLRTGLLLFVDETTPLIPSEDIHRETQPTLGFQRVLQRAVFHVQSAGKDEVSAGNVLAAIFSEQESQAVYFLKQENISRLDVINYITHGISKVDHEDIEKHFEEPENDLDNFGETNNNQSALEAYAINLNNKAKLGNIDPLIGREKEVERCIQILCRRRKNNPLFVGEPGVGKTAIAEGLAKRIVDKNIPEILANSTVYSLDLGSLLAGTKYRGDFEKRLKKLLNMMRKEKNSVLFIDEFHTIIGAGAASGGVMDASNLIKPLLSSGELRCMGSTTYQEFRTIVEKDKALERRFQKIDVKEPSIDETYKILIGLQSHFENYHNIKYSKSAFKAAAELSVRYLTDRFLPDKAIDIVDEAGAAQKLQPSDKRKKIIQQSDIEKIISKIAKVPEKTVSVSDKNKLKDLSKNIKTQIFGQNEGIDVLVTAIKMNRTGLSDENKPIGSFLFAGPTGVGKTELATVLSKELGIKLIRFDMSEYVEAHSVAKLIGSPPGYVGHDNGGLLTEAVNKNPYAVLLLDEIEKASPDVYQLLLQVMDHGSLTDSNGRVICFKHVIIVMTTNAGATEISKNSMGFAIADHSSDMMKVINKTFTPEFRNRLTAIVQFSNLEAETLSSIFDKKLLILENKLKKSNIKINISNESKTWLIKKAVNEKMGGRPIDNLIFKHINNNIADEILFGELQNGGTVNIEIEDNNISCQVSSYQL